MADGLTVSVNGTTYATPGAAMQSVVSRLQAGLAVTGDELQARVKEFLKEVADAVAKRNGDNWPSGTTGTSVSRRSGNLLRDLQDGIQAMGSTLATIQGQIVGNDYMAIQERGGVLRPSHGKYLAIPLPAALDARGVPLKENVADWGDTFVQQSRRGNILIFQKRVKEIVPLYALKTSVVIPARLGIATTAEQMMPVFTQKVLDTVLSALQF